MDDYFLNLLIGRIIIHEGDRAVPFQQGISCPCGLLPHLVNVLAYIDFLLSMGFSWGFKHLLIDLPPCFPAPLHLIIYTSLENEMVYR